MQHEASTVATSATATPSEPLPATEPAIQPPFNGIDHGNNSHNDTLTAKSYDPYLITFGPDEPSDPRNWSEVKKWTQLLLYLLPQFWAQVISSIFAPAEPFAAEAVHVSEAAMRTVQAVYLFGFAVGPIVVAPVSEDYGRRWVLFVSVLAVALCQIPCALAGSIALMLPFRFIAGFFAATTFNSIGVVGDLWSPDKQGWPVNSFALWTEAGAYLGSIIGGYVIEAAGWRWVFGVGGLGMVFILIIMVFTIKETRAGVLLAGRAKRKRKETGDDGWYCIHERQVQSKTIRDTLRETLGRPIKMLFSEPIVVATSVYDGLNYMVIYLLIAGGFSLIYGNVYGFSVGNQNLPFLSLLVGATLSFFMLPAQQAWERRCIARSPTGDLRPEERLGWLITSPLFPISLFWLAWTAVPSVHWSASVIAVGVFAFVSHIIFVGVSDYTTACYSSYAASAVGAQSLLRELLSGSVTLFTVQGYQGLGLPEFGSLVAGVAVAISALPFLLYYYGPKLRERSPFCIEQIAEERHKMEEKQRRERGEAAPASAPAVATPEPASQRQSRPPSAVSTGSSSSGRRRGQPEGHALRGDAEKQESSA